MYGAIADYYTNNYAKNPSATNGLNGVASGLGNPISANYAACGYNSVDDFVTAMKASEINQLEAFVSFIKTNKLDSALRNHQWADFAYGYNGSGYAANQYDTKIAAAYSQYA